MQMNILEAKTEFSRMIRLLETGREESITIARNGKPVAVITPYREQPVSRRIGAGKGRFTIHGDFDADNQVVSDLMSGGAL